METQKTVRRLSRLFATIQSNSSEDVTLSQFSVFMVVAEHHPEPLSHGDIRDITKLSKASISRYLKTLGHSKVETRDGKHEDFGYGLIQAIINPYDTRAHAAILSKKGIAMLQKLGNIFEGREE